MTEKPGRFALPPHQLPPTEKSLKNDLENLLVHQSPLCPKFFNSLAQFLVTLASDVPATEQRSDKN